MFLPFLHPLKQKGSVSKTFFPIGSKHSTFKDSFIEKCQLQFLVSSIVVWLHVDHVLPLQICMKKLPATPLYRTVYIFKKVLPFLLFKTNLRALFQLFCLGCDDVTSLLQAGQSIYSVSSLPVISKNVH